MGILKATLFLPSTENFLQPLNLKKKFLTKKPKLSPKKLFWGKMDMFARIVRVASEVFSFCTKIWAEKILPNIVIPFAILKHFLPERIFIEHQKRSPTIVLTLTGSAASAVHSLLLSNLFWSSLAFGITTRTSFIPKIQNQCRRVNLYQHYLQNFQKINRLRLICKLSN